MPAQFGIEDDKKNRILNHERFVIVIFTGEFIKRPNSIFRVRSTVNFLK